MVIFFIDHSQGFTDKIYVILSGGLLWVEKR